MEEKKQYSVRSRIIAIIFLVFIMGVILLVIPVIISVIGYNKNIAKYKDIMSDYPYDEYETLIEVGNDMFKEKGIMDITVKPKEVIMDGMERNDNGYTCKLTLNNDKSIRIVPDISVVIQLSKDYEILSSNYLSEEEYREVIKNNIKNNWRDNFRLGMAIELLICVLLLVSIPGKFWDKFDDKFKIKNIV